MSLYQFELVRENPDQEDAKSTFRPVTRLGCSPSINGFELRRLTTSNMLRIIILNVLLTAGLFSTFNCVANGLPAKAPQRKTVILVSPQQPGAPADAALRTIIGTLNNEQSKYQFFLENAPAASWHKDLLEKIATGQKAPDEYLMVLSYDLLTKLANQDGNVSAFKGLRYISKLFHQPTILVAPKSSGIKNLADLRMLNGQIKFRSVGLHQADVTHLGNAMFGKELLNSPARNSQSFMQETFDLGAISLEAAGPLVESGQLTPLGGFGLSSSGTLDQHEKIPSIEREKQTKTLDNRWSVLVVHPSMSAEVFDDLKVLIERQVLSPKFREHLKKLGLKDISGSEKEVQSAFAFRSKLLGGNASLNFTRPENRTVAPVDRGSDRRIEVDKPSTQQAMKRDRNFGLIDRLPDKVEEQSGQAKDRNHGLVDTGPEKVSQNNESRRDRNFGLLDKAPDKPAQQVIVRNTDPSWYMAPKRGAVYADYNEKDVKKPPFSATPYGQPMSKAPRTEPVEGVRNPRNQAGAAPGATRTEVKTGKSDDQHTEKPERKRDDHRTRKPELVPKLHQGFDIVPKKTSFDQKDTAQAKYHGEESGVVVNVKKDCGNGSLGVCVSIKQLKGGDEWVLKAMHLKEVAINPRTGKEFTGASGLHQGDVIKPGEAFGIGYGHGKIFNAPGALPAHLHYQLCRNGSLVHPANGVRLVQKSPDGSTAAFNCQ